MSYAALNIINKAYIKEGEKLNLEERGSDLEEGKSYFEEGRS